MLRSDADDGNSDLIYDRCGQSGHTDLMCRVILDHSKRIIHDFIPYSKRKSRSQYMSTLVGSANEASVSLQGIRTTALLDTGSAVSTVPKSFYERHSQSLVYLLWNVQMVLSCLTLDLLLVLCKYMAFQTVVIELTACFSCENYRLPCISSSVAWHKCFIIVLIPDKRTPWCEISTEREFLHTMASCFQMCEHEGTRT